MAYEEKTWIVHIDETPEELYYWIMAPNGEAMGRVSWRKETQTALIAYISTQKRYRNKGWGQKTLTQLEQIALGYGMLWVELETEPGAWTGEWYARNGYVFLNRDKDGYGRWKKRLNNLFN